MATPHPPLVFEEIPSHVQLSQVDGEACSTKARSLLDLSSADALVDFCAEILLVEDNANDEALTLHAFKGQNFANHVHVVRDGAEALEYVFCTGAYANRRTENPKVILLDRNLPFVDGIDVLRRIRRDPRTRLIPVVMLTSLSEECDVVETFALGVNGYIVKPLDSKQFNEVVNRLGYYSLLINDELTSGTESLP